MYINSFRPDNLVTLTAPLVSLLQNILSALASKGILLAAQHVQQVVFTHRLGQRQAASVLAARVVEVRLVKNS
jgi:hypothetical protein